MSNKTSTEKNIFHGRNYLTPAEVSRLLVAAKKTGIHGRRNYALVLLMYRHGLRASEASTLPWSGVDFTAGALHFGRLKGREGGRAREWCHPLRAVEIRALRPLWRESIGPYVFETADGLPLSRRTVYHVVAQAGALAGLPGVHPHMLRHACGYVLANGGHDTRMIQDYLGHANIRHTTRYTQLAPGRFRDLWRE